MKEGKVLIEKQICVLNVNMVCKYFLQYLTVIQKSLAGEEGVGEGGAGGQLIQLYIQGNKTESGNLLNAHVF